jgi:uroporphyrinogen decarboxylase
MNSRERINIVLDGGIPDRIPVTLFIHDEGHFLKQVYPDIVIDDYVANKCRVVDLQRDLGADIHLRLWGGCMPLWMVSGGFNTDIETSDWIVEKQTIKGSQSEKTTATVKTPAGNLYQESMIAEIHPGTFHYACTKKPLKELRDLEILEKYEPKISDAYPRRVKSIVSKVKDYLGQDGVISIWIAGGIFNHASHILDLGDLYMLFLSDYEFYKRLMDYCFNRLKPYIDAISQTEVDIINVGGNAAGGFVGRNIFEKYILPYEKKLIDYIKGKGLKTLYHNCGQIMSLLEPYKELDSDIIEPFAPPPNLGDGDLRKAKEIYDEKFIIIGNIDQVNVIQNGTPELVEEKVKEACITGKPGGRFILQPSDFLEYGTPLENVQAYVRAGKKYGYY